MANVSKLYHPASCVRFRLCVAYAQSRDYSINPVHHSLGITYLMAAQNSKVTTNQAPLLLSPPRSTSETKRTTDICTQPHRHYECTSHQTSRPDKMYPHNIGASKTTAVLNREFLKHDAYCDDQPSSYSSNPRTTTQTDANPTLFRDVNYTLKRFN